MRADRLLSIILLLQKKGKLTAAALSAEFDVSQRTIYRDIDSLSASGVPIYADGGPGGGYSLLNGYRTTLTGLTDNEIRALFMLAIPNALTDVASSNHLSNAFMKLAASLPQQYRDQIHQTHQRLYLDSTRWFQQKPSLPHLQTVQQAIWQDQTIDLTYVRQNESTNRRIVAPFALAAKNGDWYLVASTDDGMRVFRVSRIRDVIILPSTFSRPIDFDLITFWQAWAADYEASLPKYVVTLTVAPDVEDHLVHYLGEALREVLDSAENQNGHKQIDVTFERQEEAHALLLGLGTSVTVLAPLELRNQITHSASAIASHYRHIR